MCELGQTGRLVNAPAFTDCERAEGVCLEDGFGVRR
jgi:hypothetical protein